MYYNIYMFPHCVIQELRHLRAIKGIESYTWSPNVSNLRNEISMCRVKKMYSPKIKFLTTISDAILNGESHPDLVIEIPPITNSDGYYWYRSDTRNTGFSWIEMMGRAWLINPRYMDFWRSDLYQHFHAPLTDSVYSAMLKLHNEGLLIDDQQAILLTEHLLRVAMGKTLAHSLINWLS